MKRNALNPLPGKHNKRCNILLRNAPPLAENFSGPMGAIVLLPAAFNGQFVCWLRKPGLRRVSFQIPLALLLPWLIKKTVAHKLG